MSTDLNKICDELSTLTVVEISELSKMLEEKWGVSAVAVAAPAAGAAPAEAAAEAKDSFDVKLTDFGDKKINIIKEVRAITGLGLKEAKDLVEAVPSDLKKGASKDEAEEIKKKIEAAGGKIEIA
ncbi:50S ribosomal protein L7/L12 [Rickettsiales bacterium]|nr:50S ribosomal protein L7/L12 [Rickettsiales bacterium]